MTAEQPESSQWGNVDPYADWPLAGEEQAPALSPAPLPPAKTVVDREGDSDWPRADDADQQFPEPPAMPPALPVSLAAPPGRQEKTATPFVASSRPESSKGIPLIGQIAAELRRGRTFRRDLSEQDVVGIMRGVIESLVSRPQARQGAVTVESVEKMVVKIERREGTISGEVKVAKPIGVKIPVNCVLGNSERPGRLRLVRLSIGSGPTKIALRSLGKVLGVDVEAEARKQLSDSNQALTQVLEAQLDSRKVRLTGAKMWFSDNALSISLEGEPIL